MVVKFGCVSDELFPRPSDVSAEHVDDLFLCVSHACLSFSFLEMMLLCTVLCLSKCCALFFCPDMPIFAVDWALQTNYLSIYQLFSSCCFSVTEFVKHSERTASAGFSRCTKVL